MRRAVLYIFLLCAGIACRKEEGMVDARASYNGTASAALNGKPWSALANWQWYDKNKRQVWIATEVFDGKRSRGEYLNFSMVPLELGQFSLYDCYIVDSSDIDSLGNIPHRPPMRGAKYFVLEGDVLRASYCTIDSVHSFVEIQSINADSTRFSGVFEIVLTDPLGSSAPYPDTLHFVQGKFEVGPEKK